MNTLSMWALRGKLLMFAYRDIKKFKACEKSHVSNAVFSFSLFHRTYKLLNFAILSSAHNSLSSYIQIIETLSHGK